MFNVAYDAPDGVRTYQLQWTCREIAERSLLSFRVRYLNEDGSGKPYPNGKGYYPFRNPRIVRKGELL